MAPAVDLRHVNERICGLFIAPLREQCPRKLKDELECAVSPPSYECRVTGAHQPVRLRERMRALRLEPILEHLNRALGVVRHPENLRLCDRQPRRIPCPTEM